MPFTAGSGTDIVARTVAEPMSRTLGHPIIVENKPGAGGTLGAAQVAKSTPDGYTLSSIRRATSPIRPSIRTFRTTR